MLVQLVERLRAAVALRYTVEREIAAGGMGHVFLGLVGVSQDWFILAR